MDAIFMLQDDENIDVFDKMQKQINEKIIIIIRQLAEGNHEKSRNSCRGLIDLMSTFSTLFPELPYWYSELKDELVKFSKANVHPVDLLKYLVQDGSNILKHKWKKDVNSDNFIDFDNILESCVKESRIDELFDKALGLILDISKSGEINSIDLMKGLGNLINTLKISRSGSVFSMISSWEFLFRFCKKYIFMELEKIPGLGSLFTSFKELVEEVESEVNNIKDNVQIKINEELEKKAKPMIGGLTILNYDKSGGEISFDGNNKSLIEKA